MAVHSRVWEGNSDLMVTYTDDETKYLHKIGTEEYYEDPIDLINGTYTDGDRIGEPKCRFEYEEADKPVEEVVEEVPEEVPEEVVEEGKENDG